MSDAQEVGETRNPPHPRTEASSAAGTSNQQAAGERGSAATRYWQGVATAGRAAKPAAALAESATTARQRGVRA